MDHFFIDEHNQIDRYVRGSMPAAERTAFEEHFLDCPDCLEKLETARTLRESIRIAAADLAVSREPAASTFGRRLLRAFFGSKWLAAAGTACLAVVSLTGISLYRQLQRTQSDLDRAQLAYAREQERGRTMLQSTEQNAPLVYALSQSRGAGSPPTTIEIPGSPRWLVFSIGADASQFQTYRAILRNQAGQPIWQKDGLQPSSPDTIAIPVLSTALTPGNYNLSLEGRHVSGRYVPVSTFAVQAKTTP
jgi:hypothetical protein